MTMEEQLKKCPFCGAEAEIVRNGSGSYFVRCTNKQCAAKTRLYHENETGARMAWNKRSRIADKDAMRALTDEMVEMFRIGALTGEGIDRSWCRELYDKYAKRVRDACGEAKA